MKKQILNVSLLLVSSATIIAIWAIPRQGLEEDSLYVRDYKEDVLVTEEDKKDSTKNNTENGKEKETDSVKNSDTINVSKKQEPSTDQSEKPQKKVKTKFIKKTVIKTDTIGTDMELKDIKLEDYGRGIQFRKTSKSKPDIKIQKADSTL
jgi:hypothetical protein